MDTIAKGWILYRETAGFVKQEIYEVERLMETVEGIDVERRLGPSDYPRGSIKDRIFSLASICSSSTDQSPASCMLSPSSPSCPNWYRSVL